MENLIPQSTIDSFYRLIKKKINTGHKYDNLVKNLIKLNTFVPDNIQKLIDDNPHIEINHEMEFAKWCISNKEYSYDRDFKSWFVEKTLLKITWDELYKFYKQKKGIY